MNPIGIILLVGIVALCGYLLFTTIRDIVASRKNRKEEEKNKKEEKP